MKHILHIKICINKMHLHSPIVFNGNFSMYFYERRFQIHVRLKTYAPVTYLCIFCVYSVRKTQHEAELGLAPLNEKRSEVDGRNPRMPLGFLPRITWHFFLDKKCSLKKNAIHGGLWKNIRCQKWQKPN